MKWFRFYSEVLHDSKVQTLSADLFRAWVNILCLANEGDERGHLPEMKQIAFALRIKEEKAAQVIGHLMECGLIDRDESGAFRPHNWDKRQRNSDDVSNRVREHRRRKAGVTETPDVTLHETPMKHDVTERGEEKREEKTPLTPQGGDDEGGDSRNAQEDPSTLRSQRKAKADPSQLQALVDWAKAVVGQRGELEDYFQKLPGWACSYPIGWIETAVLCTAAKADIRPGGLAQYTNKCLTNWHPDGPPKAEKATAERFRRERDASRRAPASNVVMASDELFERFSSQAARRNGDR